MSRFKNILGFLFTCEGSSRNSQNNKASIKTKENYGKIAGRDIVELQQSRHQATRLQRSNFTTKEQTSVEIFISAK